MILACWLATCPPTENKSVKYTFKILVSKTFMLMYKCTIFIHTIYTHYSCTLPMFTNPVRIFCTIYMYNFHVHYCSITNLPHKYLPSSRPKCWLEWTREERHMSRMLKWYSKEIKIHRKNGTSPIAWHYLNFLLLNSMYTGIQLCIDFAGW